MMNGDLTERIVFISSRLKSKNLLKYLKENARIINVFSYNPMVFVILINRVNFMNNYTPTEGAGRSWMKQNH